LCVLLVLADCSSLLAARWLVAAPRCVGTDFVTAAPDEAVGVFATVGLGVDGAMTLVVVRPVVPFPVHLQLAVVVRLTPAGLFHRGLWRRCIPLVHARARTRCAAGRVSGLVAAVPHVKLRVLASQCVAIDHTVAPLVMVFPVVLNYFEVARMMAVLFVLAAF